MASSVRRPKHLWLYKLSSRFLGAFQVVIDSYYIFFLAPLNIWGDATLKTANVVIFATIISSEVLYRLRCPLTVWRNHLRRLWHPRFEHEDSAIATIMHKLGFHKPSLRQMQILGITFAIFVTTSFLIR